MSTHDNVILAQDRTNRRGGGIALIASAVGFMLIYLLVGVISSNLASSALPLPNDPVATTRTWFADNQAAAVMTGVLQFLSVCSLAISSSRSGAPPTRHRSSRRRAGLGPGAWPPQP